MDVGSALSSAAIAAPCRPRQAASAAVASLLNRPTLHVPTFNCPEEKVVRSLGALIFIDEARVDWLLAQVAGAAAAKAARILAKA